MDAAHGKASSHKGDTKHGSRAETTIAIGTHLTRWLRRRLAAWLTRRRGGETGVTKRLAERVFPADFPQRLGVGFAPDVTNALVVAVVIGVDEGGKSNELREEISTASTEVVAQGFAVNSAHASGNLCVCCAARI